MFDKKENIKLDKLKEGFTLKLKRKIWTIMEIAEYDWGGDGRSIEYTIKAESSHEKAFLEVEFTKGAYEIHFSTAVETENDILEDAINTKEIILANNLFSLQEEYKGAYKNLSTHGSWENLKCFVFYDKDENVLSVEKWEDKLEAFYGEEIKAKSIKNIKPN